MMKVALVPLCERRGRKPRRMTKTMARMGTVNGFTHEANVGTHWQGGWGGRQQRVSLHLFSSSSYTLTTFI